MTPATPGTRARKIRRRGRHKAPSPVRKVAKRAGVAAPAAAVAGALAAAPHLHSLTASAPKVTGAATAHLVYPVQATNAASALPASQSRAEYRARHARKPAPRPRPHPHHSAAPASAAPRASTTPAAGSGQQAAAPAASTGNLSCSASASGPLPANYAAIMDFLTSHGYTGNAAADIYVTDFERAGVPAAGTREAAAEAVAAACGI